MSASHPGSPTSRGRETFDESSFVTDLMGGVVGDIRRQRSGCELSPLRAGAATAPIFVLVHGTSPADSSWTKLDAIVPREILTVWSDAGLFAFKWAGHNRMGEAASAAFALSESVNGLKRTYPNSRIILLAHGQGGNVVAWGVDDDGSNRLRCVSAHSVPRVCPRRVPQWQALPVVPDGDVAAHASDRPGGVCATPVDGNDPWPWGIGFPFGSDLRFIALVLVAAYFSARIARQVESKVVGYRLLLIAMCTAPRQIRRELVMQVRGETFTALTLFRHLQGVIGRITRFPLRVVSGTRGASTVVLIVLFMWYRALPPTGQTAMLWASGSVLALYHVMIIGAMLLYGPIHGLMAADSTLVTSPAPRGSSESITVSVEGSGRKRPQVYGEQQVIAAVIDWLRKDDRSPSTPSI